MDVIPLKTKRLTIALPIYFKCKWHWYIEDLCELYGSDSVEKYFGPYQGRAWVENSLRQANEKCREGVERLRLIRDDKRDKVIGIIKIQKSPLESPHDVEVVYAIHPLWRGKYFAKEALCKVLDWELLNVYEPIVALVEPNNIPSIKLLEFLGFVHVDNRESSNDNMDAKSDHPPKKKIEHVYELLLEHLTCGPGLES